MIHSVQSFPVENVIHMYHMALHERFPNNLYQFNVSAPHRLDNDTSGVLILAIKSSFASYMGKFLEAKTIAHIEKRKQTDNKPSAISKRYKMLVCVESIDSIKYLQNFASEKEVITHYLSPERGERRIFKMDCDEVRNNPRWLQCNLKIISVGFNSSKLYLPAERLNVASSSGEGVIVCNSKEYTTAITEVEVELLTGRTHQIRGQMSALGFPLVGDSVYGGFMTSTDQSKIALHCSQITFPKPLLVDESSLFKNRKGYSQLYPSTSDSLTFNSSFAWWDEYVNRNI
jgi:23S rRNA-/tRNA-specific pseudouridylate synthase